MKETTKKYEFRALCSSDIFPVFNVINKIGFKEFKMAFDSNAIKALASKSKTKNDAVMSVGFDIMLNLAGIVISNAPACETDLYRLLSSVSNLSLEEVKNLSMAEFAEMILDFVQQPDFADFFKVVSRLFK